MDDLTPPERPRPARALAKLMGLGVVIGAGLALMMFSPAGDLLSRDGVHRLIDEIQASFWAPVIFIAVYTAAAALAIPGTALTLAGGALFGFFWGAIINTIAANLGASAAFLTSRLLGRDAVEWLAGKRFLWLDELATAHGFRCLFTLRLIPLVPFNALNFGSGLTSLSWATYALSTALGILPGTIIYTMFADALLDGSQEASTQALLRVLLAGVLLLSLSFMPQIVRWVRRPNRGADR